MVVRMLILEALEMCLFVLRISSPFTTIFVDRRNNGIILCRCTILCMLLTVTVINSNTLPVLNVYYSGLCVINLPISFSISYVTV